MKAISLVPRKMHIHTESFPHVMSEGLERRGGVRERGWVRKQDPLVRQPGLSSRCILKVQPTGFTDGLDVEHERRAGVQEDSGGNGKAGMGKTEARRVSNLGTAQCEMPVRNTS